MGDGGHRGLSCRRVLAASAVALVACLASPHVLQAAETGDTDEATLAADTTATPPYLDSPQGDAPDGDGQSCGEASLVATRGAAYPVPEPHDIDRMTVTVGGMTFIPWEGSDGTWHLFLPSGIDASAMALAAWDESGRPVTAWVARSETDAATSRADALFAALGERMGSLGISDEGVTFWLSPRFGATSPSIEAGNPVPMSRSERERRESAATAAGTPFELAAAAEESASAIATLPDDAPQWIRLAVMQSVGVPSVILSTSEPQAYVNAEKGNETAGRITVLSPSGTALYDDGLKWIRGRGNSTWGAEKKPYNLRLSDAADLLGTGQPDHKWRLLADYYDPSGLRNMATFDLASDLGVEETPDCTPVALWWNGEFQGSYLLTERIGTWEGGIREPDLDEETEAANARDAASAAAYDEPVQAAGTNAYGYEYRYAAGVKSPKRVDDGDLAGLVAEFDARYAAETCWFETPFGFFTVKEPDPASEGEMRAASDLFARAFLCLMGGGGPDAYGKVASDYFDIDSLARCGWLYVLSEDVDYLSVGSTYFYVASDGLIHAGPAWDFDLAWANHFDVDLGHLDFRPPFLLRITDAGNPEVRRAICDEVEPEARRLALDVLLGDASAASGGRLHSIEWYAARSRVVARMNDIRWGRSTDARLYAIDRLRGVMGGRVAIAGDEARSWPWELRFPPDDGTAAETAMTPAEWRQRFSEPEMPEDDAHPSEWEDFS